MSKVSVIIPVYNVEKYIRQCLDSVVNQTLSDIEIICINDGSTDNSLEILKEYAEKDDRFIIISQENSGQGVARNVGMEKATGEYIGFVDPDDWLEQDAFQKAYNFATKKQAQVVQFNYIDYYDSSGITKKNSFINTLKQKYNWDLMKNNYYDKDVVINDLFFNSGLHVWSRIYLKKFIDLNKIQFGNTKLGEDNLFSISAIFNANKIYFLNDYLYNYRNRIDSSVNTKNNANIEYAFINLDKLKLYLLENNLYSKYKTEYRNHCFELLVFFHKSITSIDEYEKRCCDFFNDKEYKKFIRRCQASNKSFLEKIFSIINSEDKKHKILTILGVKIKFKRKKYE